MGIEDADLGGDALLRESRFLRACRGEAVSRPPLWIMRQAGRYLPEYQATRQKAGGFLKLCRTPDLAVEVTLQPIRRFGFDAAILFSDILIPADAMGAEVYFAEGEGPRIANPIRSAADVQALRCPDPREACPYVFEAISVLRGELGPTPLISFAAAPYTLACYLIEGQTSRDFRQAKALLLGDPALADDLLGRVARYTVEHLVAGVEAGASALQLFESWGGSLGPADFERLSLRWVGHIIGEVRARVGEAVPLIYYVNGAPHGRLAALRQTGATVIGVDWRVELDEAARAMGDGAVLQGNLDPSVLLTDPDTIRARAQDVLRRGEAAGAHIMNLGHGITPDVPVRSVEVLVEAVRAFRTGEGA